MLLTLRSTIRIFQWNQDTTNEIWLRIIFRARTNAANVMTNNNSITNIENVSSIDIHTIVSANE